jgi:hypothetical protein
MPNEPSNPTPVQSVVALSANTKPTKIMTMRAVPAHERKRVGTVVSATVGSCVFYATRKP